MQTPGGGFKTCPFCREQIRQEAVKCRFCGEWLEKQKEVGSDSDSERHLSGAATGEPQEVASPSDFHFGPIVRDVAIIWVLTGLGGVIVGAADPRQTIQATWVSPGVIVSNLLFGTVGFFISGCLAKGNRWKHLGFVAFFTWYTGLVNVFLGLPFERWLSSVFVFPVLMGVGGGLSHLFKRRT